MYAVQPAHSCYTGPGAGPARCHRDRSRTTNTARPGRPDGPPTVTVGGLRFFKSSRRQPPGRGVAAAGRVGRPAPGPQRRCHGHGTGCRLCRFAPPSPLYPSVRRSLTGPRGRLEAAHSVTAVTLTPQRHPGCDRKCRRNRTVPACLPLACLFFRHS